MNTAGTRGARGERLEANSRTLSVFRPHFPQPTGTQPVSGGHPRSDIRQSGGNAVSKPTPAATRVAPVQSPRAFGGSPATSPAGGGGSGRRPDRSPNSANAAPITPTYSAPSLTRRTSDPAPRPAQPLVLHGPDRSREFANATGTSPLDQAAPPNSLIVKGNGRGTRPQTLSQSPAPTTEVPQSRPTAPSRNAFSRPAATQRTQPFTIAEPPTQAPAQPRWSAPRAVEPPVRSQRPPQTAAPALQGADRSAAERARAFLHAAARASPTPRRCRLLPRRRHRRYPVRLTPHLSRRPHLGRRRGPVPRPVEAGGNFQQPTAWECRMKNEVHLPQSRYGGQVHSSECCYEGRATKDGNAEAWLGAGLGLQFLAVLHSSFFLLHSL